MKYYEDSFEVSSNQDVKLFIAASVALETFDNFISEYMYLFILTCLLYSVWRFLLHCIYSASKGCFPYPEANNGISFFVTTGVTKKKNQESRFWKLVCYIPHAESQLIIKMLLKNMF